MTDTDRIVRTTKAGKITSTRRVEPSNAHIRPSSTGCSPIDSGSKAAPEKRLINEPTGTVRAWISRIGSALVSLGAFTQPLAGEQGPRDGGPDSVDALLIEQRRQKQAWLESNLLQPYEEWKSGIGEDMGLSWGTDYSVQYFTASDSPADHSSSAGMFRLFGSWDLVNRNKGNAGGLRFKVEHRHGFTNTVPSGYQLNLGSIGVTGGSFNDNGLRLSNLYWRQQFGELLVGYFGFLDVTDVVDVYALASPWTAFSNLSFGTGSSTIALPNDATPGFMLGGFLSEQFYVLGGMAGLNSDPREPWEGVERIFDEGELFKFLEIGWTRSKERFYLDNVHLTLWQSDSIGDTATPDGWGANFSASFWVDDCYMPFIRGGYANDGGSLLERSVSAGVAWKPREGDLFGVAANWGRPNSDTFGPGLDDQYGAEVFYRAQVTENIQITPSVQLLANPALNPAEDLVVLVGLRSVLTF